MQALGRLSAREGYDRVYRIRRAFQQEILHRDLPKAEWTKPEEVSSSASVSSSLTLSLFALEFYQDIRYLTPHIEDIVREKKERADWDNLEGQSLAPFQLSPRLYRFCADSFFFVSVVRK